MSPWNCLVASQATHPAFQVARRQCLVAAGTLATDSVELWLNVCFTDRQALQAASLPAECPLQEEEAEDDSGQARDQTADPHQSVHQQSL